MVKTLLRFALAATLAAPAGCSHVQKKFETDLAQGQCETALQDLPSRDPALHVLDQTQTAAGSAVSYSATGAAYLGDVLITVTGGAIIFVTLCGPFLAATMASHGGNGATLRCLPADLSGIHGPHLGKQTYLSTRQWRCPDLTRSSQSLRQVASCFAKREGTENLLKARATLQSISATSDFNACVSDEEKVRIASDLEKVVEQIQTGTPKD